MAVDVDDHRVTGSWLEAAELSHRPHRARLAELGSRLRGLRVPLLFEDYAPVSPPSRPVSRPRIELRRPTTSATVPRSASTWQTSAPSGPAESPEISSVIGLRLTMKPSRLSELPPISRCRMPQLCAFARMNCPLVVFVKDTCISRGSVEGGIGKPTVLRL